MKSCIATVVLLALTICLHLQAQTPTPSTNVANVYVSLTTGKIKAFTAAANGRLTPVSGSPFLGNVGAMTVNQKYVFGTDGVYIYSFSVASDGALKEVSSINAQHYNEDNCGGPTDLFLDRSGTVLYDVDYYADCANNAYQFFSINASNGALSYLGVTSDKNPAFFVTLSFVQSNRFAYGAGCAHLNPFVYGFQRNKDGSLTDLGTDFPIPTAKKGDFYCPYLTSADALNHVAVSFQAINGNTFGNDGLPQLGTYTADSRGNLTTKSTHRNMPATAITNINDIVVSPSGDLLAVGGDKGLQIFRFHGSQPITHDTGLLIKAQIDQFIWDNDNHLYAISLSAGKLFVFTVTPTSVSQAPGSPYKISNIAGITVMPKM